MLVDYPVYDISWLVAYIFVWGSIIWVINAFFSLLPDVAPTLTFRNEVLYGGGITAFVGATVFEIGSILLMLEAINENNSSCFGWAISDVLDKHSRHPIATPSHSACTHHHAHTSSLTSPTWQWLPTVHALRTHYIHSLSFLACLSQLLGATIFWIAGFTALPGIYTALTNPRLLNCAYWLPQVIGGSGFVISGTLFMLETQCKWYKPAFDQLGWWIGLWNLIGGVGFTLCPAFGFFTQAWAQEQAAVSTFWGSWAFLIGSVVQWYESLQKYPVEVVKEQ